MASAANASAAALLPPKAELLVSATDVEAAYARMAALMQPKVEREDCILLTVMLGGLVPAARLAALLRGNFTLDYCHVTRYQGRRHGGEPVFLQAPRQPLRGRTVFVVDDIFDEGITLDFIVDHCNAQGAGEVIGVALVRKLHDRAVGRARPQVVGTQVPDRYVFGCGMDLGHRWRHLPAIYALKEES